MDKCMGKTQLGEPCHTYISRKGRKFCRHHTKYEQIVREELEKWSKEFKRLRLKDD